MCINIVDILNMLKVLTIELTALVTNSVMSMM
jgi:hypothetical protein